MGNRHYNPIKDKILACYPHVYTKCIHKMLGCDKGYVYGVIYRAGLPTLRKSFYSEKLPVYSKWDNI